MKTLIWKEIRENYKWALLAMAVLALSEFYALSTVRGNSETYDNLTICSSAFLLASSFGCALTGAALGVLQILSERSRDQWAALLHRPVPRGSIFLGKVAAGLALYFPATLLPFLGSVGYAAAPGQFAAPFMPQMLLPGLSDILFGMAMYFLALLACLHKGRWWGSRGAIVLVAAYLFILHSGGVWPFLLPLGSSALLLSAGWGAMQSNGTMNARPGLSRLAGVAVIFLGCMGLFELLGMGAQILSMRRTSASYDYSGFRITRDGQVFLSLKKTDGSGGYALTHPDGKPVTDERYLGNESGRYFSQSLPLAWNIGQPVDMQREYLAAMSRYSYAYAGPTDHNRSAEKWYYLPRQNYFVGFDRLSRRKIGICDRKGFQPPDAKPEPFPQALRSATYNFNPPFFYWAGPQLYRIDFAERSMEPFYHAQEIITGVMNLSPDSQKKGLTAIALERQIHILDRAGTRISEFAVREGLPKGTLASMATNDAMDRYFVQYSPAVWFSHQGPKPETLLDVVDRAGRTLQTYSLQPPPAPSVVDWTRPITPPAFQLAGILWRKLFPPESPFVEVSPVALGGVWVNWTISLVLAAGAWLWASRAGFPRGAIYRWSLFVFLLGVPGLLAFRLAADWPVRLRCPQCGRKRAVEEDSCRSCRESWPAPAPNGTEVFDAA